MKKQAGIFIGRMDRVREKEMERGQDIFTERER